MVIRRLISRWWISVDKLLISGIGQLIDPSICRLIGVYQGLLGAVIVGLILSPLIEIRRLIF